MVDTTNNDSQELTLLKSIDGKLGGMLKRMDGQDEMLDTMSKRMDTIEATALRLGAISGGAAGAVTGGIVTLGMMFAKHHLGM